MPLSKTELKKLKSLATKKGRKTSGKFLAEGIRLLEEAWKARFFPEAVYYAPSMLTNRAEALLRRWQDVKVKTVSLSAKEVHTVSDTKTPQGIVGVFRIPSTEISELFRPAFRKVILCENISDPGNLGTLIRSALAFGFELVLLSGSSAEPYAPKVVRASAGAIFRLPVARVSLTEVKDLVEKRKLYVVASDVAAKQVTLPRRTILRRTVLLAIGSEAAGLSPELLAHAHLRIRIQHRRQVESLNAAVAGSILMKQIYDLTQ